MFYVVENLIELHDGKWEVFDTTGAWGAFNTLDHAREQLDDLKVDMHSQYPEDEIYDILNGNGFRAINEVRRSFSSEFRIVQDV